MAYFCICMRPNYTWNLPRTRIELGARTAVMGILNVTPDSFSDGGLYFEVDKAVARGREIEQEGADILDVGGESTRPGGAPVLESEELRRVLPVVEALAPRLQIPISVDTYRSDVARRVLDAGAQIINDISGLRFDPQMGEVIAGARAGVVLMHSRGARDALHHQPRMAAPLVEVREGLQLSVSRALQSGIDRSRIVIDPGIGFGKRRDESLLVLGNLGALSPLQYPLLVGVSRKSFMRDAADEPQEHRLWGTAASVAIAVFQGAHIVRVHDVRQMRMVIKIADAIAKADGE